MNTEQYYRDLMNAEIDGVITEEEARILAEHIASDPRAKQYYAQLRRTVALLDGADDLAPPAGLRERIMDAVRSDGAERKPRAPLPSPWARASRNSRSVPKAPQPGQRPNQRSSLCPQSPQT